MGLKTDKILERATVNLKKNNHENALRLFNEVLNREPSHPKALRNKALIKLTNAPFKEAEEFLLFAIDQRPEDDQLYHMLGTLYHNNDHPKKALSQFKKSLNENELNGMAHKGLAKLYANFYNEHDKAVTHFTQAIKQNSKSADLYFNRGCSYMILQEMDKAKKDLEKSSQLGHSKAKKMIENYFE